MKVAIGFFCVQEKKNYKEGDTYTGNRKDLEGFMVKESKKASLRKTKELKIDTKTK